MIISYFLKLLLLLSCYPIVYCRSNRVRRIVGGLEADVAPYDEPVAYVRYNGRSATVRGVLDAPHYSFRGIRYAESPTDVNRFQKPKKYILNGDYNATHYSSPCLQPVPGSDNVAGAEDCLFLNVYTPKLPEGDAGLPVIVWIHGGGFRSGSASQYGEKHFMKKNIVLVTIQYRLGSLGFLSSGSPEFPGNAGIFDMAMAVEWTNNYVGFFGGDAKKITVMGHGTGASSALLLALSNVAKSIPCGVIAMSGTAISNWAIDKTPSNTLKEVSTIQGCLSNNTVKMIKCLQRIPAEDIIKGDNKIESTRLREEGFLSGLCGLLGSSPVTEGVNDGRMLPAAIQREPFDDMSAGRIPKIPLLTGITKDETKKAITDQYKEEISSKLHNVSDYLNNILVKNLISTVDLIRNKTNPGRTLLKGLDPFNFGGYIDTTADSIVDGFNKVAEFTGDALFNLPAFVTADLWSKNKMSYLYRFEHAGKAPKGNAFLKGLPLVSNQAQDDATVSHGDDLSYLFEPRNLDGSPIEENQIGNEQDEKVRDIFTQIITDFATEGKVRVQNSWIPPFSSGANSVFQIKPEPEILEKFRYCEMGLWGGLADRLQDVSCQVKDAILNVVPVAPLMNVTNQLDPNRIADNFVKPFGGKTLRKPWLG